MYECTSQVLYSQLFAGIKAMMVVVADDVALPEGKGITGGRGIAGTVFVHKVAGAMVRTVLQGMYSVIVDSSLGL